MIHPTRRVVLTRLVALGFTGLAGCSEREVVVGPTAGKGTGKSKGYEDSKSKSQGKNTKRSR